MVTVVAANAQPARRSNANHAAASAASTAANSTGLSSTLEPAVAWVQNANATTAQNTTGATRRASRTARSRTSPVVFRARNVAPYSTQIATSVMPVNIAVRLQQVARTCR